MATFLDIGLFQHFSVIFTFLLIFVITYGLLSVQKIIKFGNGDKGIYALIALSLSFLAVTSGGAVAFIGFLTPWFTAFIIFLFFIFFIFRMWVGDDESYFSNAIKQNRGLQWTMIVVAILILIAALSNTFGQQLLEDNPQVQTSTSSNTVTIQADNSNQATGQPSSRPPNQPSPRPSSEPSATSTDFSSNVLSTFIHPKVLGMLLIILIGFFSILFLAKNQDPNM